MESREENIYTTCGIDSAAGDTLWKMVKDNPKERSRVLSVISEYATYYKHIQLVNTTRIRRHFMLLLAREAEEVVMSRPAHYSTYLCNVLKTLYKQHMRISLMDARLEKLERNGISRYE